MATPAEILREIHRLRRYVTGLQNKIESLPKKHETLKAVLEHQEKQLAEAQDHIKHLKVQAHEGDVSLKATGEQIDKYRKQLNDIISKKEFDALNHEIAHAEQTASELEDQILTTLTEIDEYNARIPGMEKAVEQARQELAEFEQQSETQRVELTSELEKAKQELVDTESNLPEGDLRIQYQRLVRQRGDEAFSPAKNRTCQACYTEVTAQMYYELIQGKFFLCKSCGRILYLAD